MRADWSATCRLSAVSARCARPRVKEARIDPTTLADRRRGERVERCSSLCRPIRYGDRKVSGSTRMSCVRRDASACRIVAVASPRIESTLSNRPLPSTARLPAPFEVSASGPAELIEPDFNFRRAAIAETQLPLIIRLKFHRLVVLRRTNPTRPRFADRMQRAALRLSHSVATRCSPARP